MTKKDYELIATELCGIIELYKFDYLNKGTRTDSYKVADSMLDTIIQLARRLAMKLQADNVRFDRTKFLLACGLTETAMYHYEGVGDKPEGYSYFNRI